MKVKVEFGVTEEMVSEAILEHWRVNAYVVDPRGPRSKTEALRWIHTALRSHGLGLWTSVADAPAGHRKRAQTLGRQWYLWLRSPDPRMRPLGCS